MEYGEKHPEESGGRLSDDGRDPLLDHPQGNPQQQDCGGQQRTLQSHLFTASVIFFCFSLIILTITISAVFRRPQNYCVKALNPWCEDFIVCTAEAS